MHPSTFEYLQPTEDQISKMGTSRAKAKEYAKHLDATLPNGPDKTYIIRKFRELAMWINVSITRDADGTPRT